jgi:hypothetical protein
MAVLTQLRARLGGVSRVMPLTRAAPRRRAARRGDFRLATAGSSRGDEAMGVYVEVRDFVLTHRPCPALHTPMPSRRR